MQPRRRESRLNSSRFAVEMSHSGAGRSLTLGDRLIDELGAVRTDWSLDEVRELFALPFSDLIYHAQRVHRRYFDPNQVQISTLLSIKTGACPEDCSYCSQSIRFETGLKSEPLMNLDEVLEKARAAKANGATRFCMGAAYRSPKPKQLAQIVEMIKGVREMGMETCVTLGMVTPEQAHQLKDAGLDYYNHNLDTSESHYKKVITTRTYQDRLDTLEAVRSAGINVCCGGILGLGEQELDRAQLLHTLATLPQHPDSVPINQLMQVQGTPLYGAEKPDALDFVRVIAVARLLMPRAHVRLSAGRSGMSDETQALCFLAGANSIFYGDKLLTTENPEEDHDRKLFAKLGITAEALAERPATCSRAPDHHPEQAPTALAN
jgi:biotin synthase